MTLHAADGDHTYIIDRPLLLPWLVGSGIGVLSLLYSLLLIAGAILDSDPVALILGAGILLGTLVGVAVCIWGLHRVMNNTRRVDIVGSTSTVTVSWLNWRGRVRKQIDTPAAFCTLRLHPVLIENISHRNRRAREIAWRALNLNAAGEDFVLTVQGSSEGLQAYIRQLPRTLRHASVSKGLPIRAKFRRTISKRGKADPTRIETGIATECRGCGYDLSGLPLDQQQCPECGIRRLA